MSYLPCASADQPTTDAEAHSLGDLVKKVIRNIGGRGRVSEEDMLRAWHDAVGPEAARHSRPVSFKRSSVFVEVDRSAWLYELTVQKKEILGRLGGLLKGKKFKDIRFRIGDLGKKASQGQKDEERKA